jgi:hypothetical protein
MQSHGQQTDAAPAIEPPMHWVQLWRLGRDEHRRQRNAETTSRVGHGAIQKNAATAPSRQSRNRSGEGAVIQSPDPPAPAATAGS